MIHTPWLVTHLCLQANPSTMMQTVILMILRVRYQLFAEMFLLTSIQIYMTFLTICS